MENTIVRRDTTLVGKAYAGGICGYSTSSVKNCYNLSNRIFATSPYTNITLRALLCAPLINAFRYLDQNGKQVAIEYKRIVFGDIYHVDFEVRYARGADIANSSAEISSCYTDGDGNSTNGSKATYTIEHYSVWNDHDGYNSMSTPDKVDETKWQQRNAVRIYKKEDEDVEFSETKWMSIIDVKNVCKTIGKPDSTDPNYDPAEDKDYYGSYESATQYEMFEQGYFAIMSEENTIKLYSHAGIIGDKWASGYVPQSRTPIYTTIESLETIDSDSGIYSNQGAEYDNNLAGLGSMWDVCDWVMNGKPYLKYFYHQGLE